MNCELPDIEAGFRKDRGTRDHIANICWIIKKERISHMCTSVPSLFLFFLKQKKQFQFCFLDYAKAFDCVDHNKLWKTLQEMGIPDYLTYLLRNLYAGQEENELDMEQQTGSI